MKTNVQLVLFNSKKWSCCSNFSWPILQLDYILVHNCISEFFFSVLFQSLMSREQGCAGGRDIVRILVPYAETFGTSAIETKFRGIVPTWLSRGTVPSRSMPIPAREGSPESDPVILIITVSLRNTNFSFKSKIITFLSNFYFQPNKLLLSYLIFESFWKMSHFKCAISFASKWL